jgi:adenylate cyclase
MYDPSAGDDQQRALLDEMMAQGLSVDVLAATPRLGGLVLQIFDRLIRPGAHVTLEEAAVSSGVKAADIMRVRRAWGFPDPEPGERCFMEADVETLSFVRGVAGFVGPELTLHLARATGTAMSRVAEAEIALIRSQLEGREETRAASVASILLRYRGVLEVFLPAMLRMLDAVHRGHLVHVGRRYARWALPPSEYNVVDMVVGFADLTHSTALVSRLDLAGLDRALTAFEDVTTDQIASAGATLVKRLGDGVMFVTPEADVACNLGRRLVGAMRDDPTALPVRVGLAAGHVPGAARRLPMDRRCTWRRASSRRRRQRRCWYHARCVTGRASRRSARRAPTSSPASLIPSSSSSSRSECTKPPGGCPPGAPAAGSRPGGLASVSLSRGDRPAASGRRGLASRTSSSTWCSTWS